jgi:hypothetical protein
MTAAVLYHVGLDISRRTIRMRATYTAHSVLVAHGLLIRAHQRWSFADYTVWVALELSSAFLSVLTDARPCQGTS